MYTKVILFLTLAIVSVLAVDRKLTVGSAKDFSYSFDEEGLIGYVTTNVYIFNDNKDHTLWVNTIESSDSALAGDYNENVAFGEYALFQVEGSEFVTTVYYDPYKAGSIAEENILYILLNAPDQYTLESSVTYISKGGEFEFSYVSAWEAELSEDGTSFTGVANLTITAGMPSIETSLSYSYDFNI
eukprot:CAMPEP_0113952790 /NCGR_PEP_ID=MMETSP1339-20121228/90620_1 /TAXON_ID=94617 /ORGANISM="Fibrocapsa japonica" /LENGTH=185 /DNA_ID=CAMNT_0000961455 /DNA_START=159 /DNA_END=716 /DNA_ORIENTATION=- /assembly_acc=CAM_ASM_000762